MVASFLGKIKEKVRNSESETDPQKEEKNIAEPKKQNNFEETPPKTTEETIKKLVVVGRESVFSPEIIAYALEMAERMSYEVIALNTAPLSCDTFRMFSASRDKVCEDFENLSKKNVRLFQDEAEKRGIPFIHIVKFSESNEVLLEIRQEIGEFEFVVSESDEGGNIAAGENGKKREILVYSIM